MSWTHTYDRGVLGRPFRGSTNRTCGKGRCGSKTAELGNSENELIKNGRLVTAFAMANGAINFIDHDEVTICGIGGRAGRSMGDIRTAFSLNELVIGRAEKARR